MDRVPRVILILASFTAVCTFAAFTHIERARFNAETVARFEASKGAVQHFHKGADTDV